MITDDVSDSYQ